MKRRKLTFIFVIFVFLLLGIGVGMVMQKYLEKTHSAVVGIPRNVVNLPVPDSWKNKEGFIGNSFETADDIQFGVDAQGTFNPGNILDFYKFDLKQSSSVIVTVSNVPKDFGFVLYDKDFDEVAHTYRYGSVSGTTTIKLQNTGRYYIKAFGNYADVTNQSYLIRVSVQPFFEN